MVQGKAYLIGLLLAGAGATAGLSASAQTPPSTLGRLTVRPHAMATGTRTAQAGLQQLKPPDTGKPATSGKSAVSSDSADSDDSADSGKPADAGEVYVPESCVGERRCPLVVFLESGASISTLQSGADRYGAIVLRPRQSWGAVNHDEQLTMDTQDRFLIRQMPAECDSDVVAVDYAMKEVLANFAIDPDKIALVGNSNGGGFTLFLGRNNLDVFGRIGTSDPARIWTGLGPPNTTTQFFVVNGTGEGAFWPNSLTAAKQDRRTGHRVAQAAAFRDHAWIRQIPS